MRHLKRLCPARAPSAYWLWISRYPYEASLVVVCATQTLALVTLYSSGAALGYHHLPTWVTLAVAGMFGVCGVLLAYAVARGTDGLVATALRATTVALATLVFVVLPGGVAPAEVVVMIQVAPFVVLSLGRSFYLEAVWRRDHSDETAAL